MDTGSAGSAGASKVLVIGGWGRCGSTLLDMMLGQLPGFVSAGEIRELWLRGRVEDRPCGCGASFHACPFWTKVGDEAYGGWDRLDIDRVLRVRYRVDRPWGAPRLHRAVRPERRPEDIAFYADTLSRLYRAIRSVTGASVVIDSSKLPTHTMMLRCVPDLDVRLLHLVRDSRGVAYSNQKVVLKDVTSGEPTLLPINGALAASVRYTLYNGLTASLSRSGMPYLRMRYEDLIRSPERHLRVVLAFAGEPADVDFPFLGGGAAALGENHLVDGNPVRFTKGSLALKVDDEWRSRLPAADRRVVTSLTLPMLFAYGYPIRPR
ncbi:MAG TPA: sulfotransferase [Kribbellaceae bacterium]|nr:sulfotransferase [Kribbellaceae bacterium]